MVSRILIPFAIAAGFSITSLSPARAANHNVQVGPGFAYSPAQLTIQQGDTVTWTNAGGSHNVQANNGSFRCANGCDGQGGNGNPASNAWSATVTFNSAGIFDYFCAVHQGVGMTGRITVQGGGGGQSGSLRFATSNTPVDEAAGNVRLTVQRINGSDGAASVGYSTSNGSATAGQDYSSRSGTLSWGDGDGASKFIDVPILDDAVTEPNQIFNIALSNATGAALGTPSSSTVTIRDDDEVAAEPGVLAFAEEAQQVAESAGSAQVTVNRTDGSDNAVSVGVMTMDGSATAGSDYSAVTQTLSWADGDSSPKSFAVPILDDAETEPNEVVHLGFASPTGGATLGEPSAATLTVLDDDGDFEPCVPGAETLCLGDGGRFKVEVDWRDRNGNTGAGLTVDIDRRDSGLFYFFNQNNIEMLVKILDACPLAFNSYFVFYAATTNVEFTLTVTDTEAEVVKQYFNPLGNAAEPVQDTRAFETCP